MMKLLARYRQPAVSRFFSRTQWITPHNLTDDGLVFTPTALDVAALVAFLEAEGWAASSDAAQVSTSTESITIAQLEACDLSSLSGPLENDVREELTRQGICP